MNIRKKQCLIFLFLGLFGLIVSTNLLAQEADELFRKVRDNDIKAIKELIASGVDVNQQYEMDGNTPLIIACTYNYVDLAKLLIAEGADINIRGKMYGHTPLIIACNLNYVDLAKLLIAEGADINIRGKDGSTALITAGSNSQELVEILLSKGADIKAKLTNGTGVFRQCINGIISGRVSIQLAESLLSKGAEVNESATTGDIQGYTPLMAAAYNNKLELVNFLIKNGANVNAKSGDGSTALSLATEAGHQKIINLLKSNGAK